MKLNVGESIAMITGDSKGNKDKLLTWIRINNRLPSQRIPDEQRMFSTIRNYLGESQISYDVEFRDRVEELCPIRSPVDATTSKLEILTWVKTNGRRPGLAVEERIMTGRVSRFARLKSPCYDPEFAAKLENLVPLKVNVDHERSKLEILAWVNTNGRRPTLKEGPLYGRMYDYMFIKSPRYDAEFKSKLESISPSRETISKMNKELIITWIKANGRRPRARVPSEKSMASMLADRISPKSQSYNEEFRAKVEELCPIKDVASIKNEVLTWIKLNNRKPQSNKDCRIYRYMRIYGNPKSKYYDSKFKAKLDKLLLTFKEK